MCVYMCLGMHVHICVCVCLCTCICVCKHFIILPYHNICDVMLKIKMMRAKGNNKEIRCGYHYNTIFLGVEAKFVIYLLIC